MANLQFFLCTVFQVLILLKLFLEIKTKFMCGAYKIASVFDP